MIVRTIGFNPLKVEVNGTETPVLDFPYTDENGVHQNLFYVMVDGEKFPIQHRVEIEDKLRFHKVDAAIALVEVDRQKKIDDAKVK